MDHSGHLHLHLRVASTGGAATIHDRRNTEMASTFLDGAVTEALGISCSPFPGNHPHLYEAVNGGAVDASQRLPVVEPVLTLLRTLLTSWERSHEVDLGDSVNACHIVWGTLHGMATLGGLDTVGNQRAQQLATQAMGATLRGWSTEHLDSPGRDRVRSGASRTRRNSCSLRRACTRTTMRHSW
jgi:hypothetical protein